MKNYLAVFLGKPKAMDKWRAMPEAERKQREKAGIEAWHKWVADHKDAIVEMGSPLGKTKRIDKEGVSDTRNELGAWTACLYPEDNSHPLRCVAITLRLGERQVLMRREPS